MYGHQIGVFGQLLHLLKEASVLLLLYVELGEILPFRVYSQRLERQPQFTGQGLKSGSGCQAYVQALFLQLGAERQQIVYICFCAEGEKGDGIHEHLGFGVLLIEGVVFAFSPVYLSGKANVTV